MKKKNILEDEQFNDEKAFLLKQIQELPVLVTPKS